MKNYVRFLLALGQRAAVSDTNSNSLSTRAADDIGCYALDTTDPHTSVFNSLASCSQDCTGDGYTVFAARGQSCMCLDSMPSDDKKVDTSSCDVACPGYPGEMCGGQERGYYSVREIDAIYWNNSTNTSSADADSFTYSATITTATQTTLPTASGVSSDSTSTGSSSVATPSGSASGSSASPSSTVESTNAAAPVFDASFTVVSSLVGAVALLVAFV